MKLTLTERFRAFSQEPIATARKFGVTEGQIVADIGAGHGYFTVAAAIIAGPTGFVYAVEPDPSRSQSIRDRVASEGLQNVRVLTTTAERLEEIPSDSVDLAFSAFSIHHFSDKEAGMAEIKRVLRPGGAFYIWDRVPGLLIRHGTRPDEINQSQGGFSKFELLGGGRTLRARFTK